MSEYSTDVRAVFSKGTTARTSLLDLVPKVERVDSYADSKFVSTLEPLRTEVDDVRQNQKETATELKSVIDTWLLIHDYANDSTMQEDIINECTNMLNILNKNNSKANTSPEKINAIAEQISNLKNVLESTIAEKDKAIDTELDESTEAVTNLQNQISALDAKLKELYDKLNQGNVGKVIDAGKGLADKLRGSGSTTTKTTTSSGGSGDDQTAIKEEIKKVEAQRAAVQGQLDTARERKSQAVAVGDRRTHAKAADPVGSTNSAHMKILSWSTSSDGLLALYKAFSRDITSYQSAFQANKDDSSDANKKALAEEIKKVDGYVPKLKELARALVDGANNY